MEKDWLRDRTRTLNVWMLKGGLKVYRGQMRRFSFELDFELEVNGEGPAPMTSAANGEKRWQKVLI